MRRLVDGLAVLAGLAEISARSLELARSRKPLAADVLRASRTQRKSAGPLQAAAAARPAAQDDLRRTGSEEPVQKQDRVLQASDPVPVAAESTVIQADSMAEVSKEVAEATPQQPASINPPPTNVASTPPQVKPEKPSLHDYTPTRLSNQSVTYSAVPSTRLGRLFHYGGLAADIGFGAISQTFSGGQGTDTGDARYPLSEASVRRLVSRMSRMRGAALKIGQFASMQGAKILPPQIEEIMLKVQHSAHFMPEWQVSEVLSAELGSDWRDKFGEFDMKPMAAASIGQVHFARLPDRTPLAVKVQFPGVAQSVQSDIRNIGMLLRAGALLPKGLFLDSSLAVLGRELADECDYRREAAYGQAFERLLRDDPAFSVPKVVDELSSTRVLTTEYATGRTLSNVDDLSQELRDEIGTKILRLCLREVFHFRLMQTDPNWSNFLWQADRHEIELIDFGAGRRYATDFVEAYLGLLRAAISGDRNTCIALSRQIGYLTGEENEAMEEAHYQSMAALGEPFQRDAARPYSFRDQTITDRVRAQMPIMVRHRLTPPPKETYSLNRKLSGCFLLCSRLGSRIDCVGMLEEVLSSMEAESKRATALLADMEQQLT